MGVGGLGVGGTGVKVAVAIVTDGMSVGVLGKVGKVVAVLIKLGTRVVRFSKGMRITG
jgi:hypothetical protein